MQADLWKALLRRVPAEQSDNLMVMTAQGTEINVQMLLRMEADYVVLRGRIAGSNDAGRIFIVPYEHLDHAGFQKPLSDAQLEGLFTVAPAAAPPPSVEPAPPPEPAAVAPEPPAAPGSPSPDLLAKVPTRSKIIQRLRLRTEARDAAGSAPKE